MYTKDQILDPNLLFERRTVLMRSRILKLLNDYEIAYSYITKAIILEELNNLIDAYVERSLVLQKARNN